MSRLLSFLLCFFAACKTAFACDPCALYNVSRLQGHCADTFTLSVSEQYTDFDRAQGIPENSIKDSELVRGFSTTQFALAYDLNEEIGFQVSLPVIGRRFDEIENYRADTDSDGGIGDLAISATYSFIDYRKGDWTAIAGLTAGIKLPTGDTGVLRDVTSEESHENALLRHHTLGTSSGGRALTFGTGSYDYITGVYGLARISRYVAIANFQYNLRTEGDFDYEFADDLLFTFSPGYYFLLDDSFSVAGLVSLTGEFKGKDHLGGELVEGSQISNLYLGPETVVTINESLSANLGFDFRITDEDLSTTVVPEARIRASISYRFS